MNELILCIAITAPIGLLLGYVFEDKFWSLPHKQWEFLMYAIGSIGASIMIIGMIFKLNFLLYFGQASLTTLVFALLWMNRTVEEPKPLEPPPPPEPPEPPPQKSAEERLKEILDKNRRG